MTKGHEGLKGLTGHRVTVEPSGRHVRVVHGGQVLAESDAALVLHETGLPDRYYIPPRDVRLDLLTPSGTRTHCPFKGDASYWSLPDAADLVWAYPEPKAEVAEIKDHLCFYEVEAD
ncbi:DUF427 domain-containing protein [Streptomyces olivaceus]|uniref:DUF427 domain-containing protein n=1 Tax=Streptomyces TaxID=1883 RepID=UPI001CCA349D|nr:MULTISPECIES: DUF427 domain-containing protein [Streptomyces]MCM8554478.1 DUF427 domain-containing protein [Streptomyces sp. STCH 565 A]MCU8589292.1 DUF427 domain-containing protein [Streptomyces sp. A13(2022)]UOG84326.1 DUF427 domain-containing protein [Streptomyces sp. CB09030]WFB88854.1 DUF427 domain-containing protein [Streptomyces olivaceus]WGK51279.1 DUF427 domain-containing protein [Streptomyces sp. B146]